MEARRVGLFVAVTCGAIALTMPSCREPTQVTLDISLDPSLSCAEIAPGTAITVGVDPEQVEKNVADKNVSTKTNLCDDATHHVGTIVITPSERGTAAVTVVVGYDRDPLTCRPPLYEGCIVARRRFSFVEHVPLRIPVVIDPDCKDVPCDAFSTCARGSCFNSEVTCPDGNCERPGDLPDGAPDDDASVEPDAPQPGRDSGSDADARVPFPGEAYCATGLVLHCRGYMTTDDLACGGPKECCDCGGVTETCEPGPPCFTGPRYCCVDADCGLGRSCREANGFTPAPAVTPGMVGHCSERVATCDSQARLQCPPGIPGPPDCNGPASSCCTATNIVPTPPPVCRYMQATCNTFEARRCCSANDCGGTPCNGGGGPNSVAGTCNP